MISASGSAARVKVFPRRNGCWPVLSDAVTALNREWCTRIRGGLVDQEPLYSTALDQAETTVIEASPTFKVIGKNTIGERCQASMAVSDGQVFIRTEKNLYCIGRR